MAKKHKEIIHNTEKTRHERSECSSFYGSLFVIMFLIIATAMLLTNSGNNNVTGMATAPYGNYIDFAVTKPDGSSQSIKYTWDSSDNVYKAYTSTEYYYYSPNTNLYQIKVRNSVLEDEIYTVTKNDNSLSLSTTILSKSQNIPIVIEGIETTYEFTHSISGGSKYYAYDSEGNQIQYDAVSGQGEIFEIAGEIFEIAAVGNPVYADKIATFSYYSSSTLGSSSDITISSDSKAEIVSKAGNLKKFEYAQDTNTLTVEIEGNTYKYEVVEIGGQYYAKKTSLINGVETTFYTDKEGMIWKYEEEKLVKSSAEGTYNSAFVDSSNKVLPIFSALLQEEKERGIAAKKMETYNALAAQIDPNGQITGEDIIGEETAINAYLDLSESTREVTYDVTTGHYEGTMSYGEKNYVVDYNNDDIGIRTTVQNQKGESVLLTIYKDTSKVTPTYYTLSDKGQRVSYKPDEAVKSDLRKAEHAVEDVEEDIEREMQKCAKASSDEGCQLTYETADGRTIRLDATARQEAFMNRLYAEQEAKVQGLIAGWLNGWIDEKLGGWSRGVPAGICANIFGLEYYKQDGWTRVAMNSSVDQLQSTLIANSRTVIIEGEKEEITEDMFRYAYSIKLLANQSVEWQTYLYNSCTQETSVDTFYDYGSLIAGGYFAFHYAGAGTQDMIFACEEEICLYDQACVVFADGTAPTCVSLVHGAGFETPVAGSDYDCAITG